MRRSRMKTSSIVEVEKLLEKNSIVSNISLRYQRIAKSRSSKINNSDFYYTHFVDIVIEFENCTFDECHFKKCGVGFINCTFKGKNTFDNCSDYDGPQFQNCIFENKEHPIAITNGGGMDLSTVPLASSKDFMKKFKRTDEGYIVYKAFGYNTPYGEINRWGKIYAGRVITETVNYHRDVECGCGVNFATLEWINRCIISEGTNIYECLLAYEDACDICVPFNTDGKARCGRLKLLRKVDKKGRPL